MLPCLSSFFCTISLGWLCATQLHSVERNRKNTDMGNAIGETFLSLTEYSYNALRSAFQQSDNNRAIKTNQLIESQLANLTESLQRRNGLDEQQLAKIIASIRSLKNEVDEIKDYVRSERFDNNISRMSAIAPAVSHGQLLSLDVDDYLRKLKINQNKDQQLADQRERLILEASVAIVLLSSLAVCCISLSYASTVARRLRAIRDNQALLIDSTEPQLSNTVAKDELDYVNQILCETAVQLSQIMNETKQLIQMIAHDLRSPLMSVQVLIVMFSERYGDILSESELLTCDRLESLLVDISDVVTDLLIFDSLKSGHCQPKFSPTDLHEIIQQSISKNRKAAHSKGIRIDNLCPSTMLPIDKELTTKALSLCLKRAIQKAPEDSTITLDSKSDSNFTCCTIAKNLSHKTASTTPSQTALDESTKDALYLGLIQLVAHAHGGYAEFSNSPKPTYQLFFPEKRKIEHAIDPKTASEAKNSIWAEIRYSWTTTLGRAGIFMTSIALLVQIIGFLLMSSQVYAAQMLKRETDHQNEVISILNTTWTKTYEANSALAFYILDGEVENRREAINAYETLSALIKSASEALNKDDLSYNLWLEAQTYVDMEVAHLRKYLDTPRLSSRTDALGTLPKELERAEQVHLRLQSLLAHESRSLAEKQIKLSSDWHLLQSSLTGLSICNFIILIALALRFKKKTWDKLDRVIQTAHVLGQGEAVKTLPLDHADELGEIDRALHTISKDLETTRAESKSITIMLKEEIEGPLQRGLSELQDLQRLDKLDRRQSSSQDQDLERAIAGTKRLIVLVNELFDLAAGRNPRLVIINRLNRLDYFANEIAQTMNVIAAEKHIHLEVSAPAETAYFDSGRIGQVVTNLINNAIKFSPQHSKIMLECSTANGLLRFKISDEGPGIPDADLDKIFDKHYKTEQKVDKAFGLGLALCKSTIEACSGSISVQNNATTGATFTVEIPAIE